jgi:methionyl-tRNA formyltransferase
LARIVYMSLGRVLGVEILKWLRAINENIVALVVTSHERDVSERGKIIQASGLAPVSGLAPKDIFLGSELRQPDFLKKMRQLKPDYILSVYFPHILRKELLDIPAHGAINMHPSYLPYNRGAGGSSWSIIEGTPHGITLHYMDEGIDSGDIIAQKEVKIDFTDTAATLRTKLDIAGIELFKENWESIKKGTNKRIKQPPGTYHAIKGLEKIQEIDLNQTYKAEYLITLLRALTGASSRAYVRLNDGRKVNISVSLEEATD